jgi:hypothetical protein
MSWHFWIFPLMFFWFFGVRRWRAPSERGRGKRTGRRNRANGWDPVDTADVDTERELEEQRGYIEAMEQRIAELENRLDFTERLLAQRSGSES